MIIAEIFLKIYLPKYVNFERVICLKISVSTDLGLINSKISHNVFFEKVY